MNAPSNRSVVTLILGAILTSACGGGGGDGGMPPATTAITKLDGDAQQGVVGQPLTTPLRIRVTEDGAPSAGATVAWSTAAAGGSVNPGSAVTDASGDATTIWSLGTVAGTQSATATLPGATGSPLNFTARAVAGAGTTLTKAGGDGQTGETNSELAQPLRAKVADEFGNGVAGTVVAWSSSGASLSATSVVSDAAGISQIAATLGGTAGPITIEAEAQGLNGSPLTFTATVIELPPAPTTISIAVGNDFFRSDRNTTANPAVDTVAVGGTVTWTWQTTAIQHDVTSTGTPGFASSSTMNAPAEHSFTFSAAGTYRYYCSIHATASSQVGMVGRIVVR